MWLSQEDHFKQRESVQFSCSVVSDSLRPHELQHTSPPCSSPTPRVHPNSRPLSRWCHPTISSSVVPFSPCPQSLPASGSFPMSQLFAWGGQRIGVSASISVSPMNTQDWSPLGWTGWLAPTKLYSTHTSYRMKGAESNKLMAQTFAFWLVSISLFDVFVNNNF